MEEFLELIKSREVSPPKSFPLFLVGDIAEANYGIFMLQLANAEQSCEPDEGITIKLTSTGGSAGLGFALYDAIRASPLTTTVQCFGYCCSAAVLPLMAADKRIASKYCCFLLHEVSVSMQEPANLNKKNLMDHHRELETLFNDYCAILAKRTKQSVKFIKELCKKETTLTAKEALKLNLIDEII